MVECTVYQTAAAAASGTMSGEYKNDGGWGNAPDSSSRQHQQQQQQQKTKKKQHRHQQQQQQGKAPTAAPGMHTIGSAKKTLARTLAVVHGTIQQVQHKGEKGRNSRKQSGEGHVRMLDGGKVDVRLLSHVGFPDDGDSIAYDAVQKLLAVGFLFFRGRRKGGGGEEFGLLYIEKEEEEKAKEEQ